MIPGSLPKVFLRLKMGDACAVSNPAVLIQRAQVPKMHPRETENDAREPPKSVFAPQNGACMCSIKSRGYNKALFGAKDASLILINLPCSLTSIFWILGLSEQGWF